MVNRIGLPYALGIERFPSRRRSMGKKIKLPESPLKDEDWPWTRPEELHLYLQMQRQLFEANRSHALPAFDALTYIVTEIWDNAETPRDCAVTIPLWIVETLAGGFLRYRNAAESGRSVTFGEAYGIEGGGQGKEPRILIEFRKLRDIRVVTTIAFRKEQGIKIEASIQEMSEKTGLSRSQVRRIWQKHRKQAVSAVRNLKTRMSS